MLYYIILYYIILYYIILYYIILYYIILYYIILYYVILLYYIIYIIYTRGIPSAKTLKCISIKNRYIKIQWMGLIFQGVVFEFNSAPQMYLEVFFEFLEGRGFPDGIGDFVPSF